MAGVQIATYILALVFVIAFAAKMIKYQKMPIHLRWELYPVAGETKRPWGGSYLEEPNWQDKPYEKHSLLGEIKFMAKEIFFFKEYIESNKSLWRIVYPFHLGVFLFVAFFALVVVGAITMELDTVVASDSTAAWGKIVFYLTLVVGIAALALGTLGCLALLIRKFTDNTMSPYTRRIEYINIFFVLVVFATGLISWIAFDSNFDNTRAYMQSLFTFNTEVAGIDALTSVHIILLAVFLAYMPFTNIMHFFAKHFTFNSVRWEDKPHLRGSALERKLLPNLQQPVTWSASHTQSIQMWTDVAKGDVEVEGLGRRAVSKEDD
ncbi:respiratory nitrate reductase subunit gamma [Chloroflexota bacterium]